MDGSTRRSEIGAWPLRRGVTEAVLASRFDDSAVEKRPTKIFSHGRPACVRCQSPRQLRRRMIVSLPDVQRRFVRHCASQREGQSFLKRGTRRACAQCLSGELSRVHSLLHLTRRWLKVNSHDKTTGTGVDCVSRKMECKRGTRRAAIYAWTRWGVSDPLRSGRGVRFALQGGGRSRPSTDVDHPRGACGGIKRRRHLDHRAPGCSCCEMGCERLISGVANELRFETVAVRPTKGGRLRSEPSAPLSAPSHLEGGQLRSRRSSPLMSPWRSRRGPCQCRGSELR